MGQKLKNLNLSRGTSKKSEAIVPVTFTLEQKNELEASMDYLKCTVVNNDNMNQIRAKLIETMKYRSELMKDPKTDIRESFPYFFVSTDLVSDTFM